jgi:predicted acylesterase/phospholipase RssA
MTFNTLVISGGGPTLIQVLAAVQECEKEQIIIMSELTKIYGTSAGAVIGVMISLGVEWDSLNNYIINRPWHEVFPIKIQTFIEAFYSKGLFSTAAVEKCFEPLFKSKDIPLNITMSKFHELCGIEHHIFAFDVNTFEVDDISYITHPDLLLITALHMTCAIPILFSPVCIDQKCYIDGGIICNYPIHQCLTAHADIPEHEDRILGFRNQYGDNADLDEHESLENELNINTNIADSGNIFEYGLNFIVKLINNFNSKKKRIRTKHEIVCKTKRVNLNTYKQALMSVETRRSIFSTGIESAKTFITDYKARNI